MHLVLTEISQEIFEMTSQVMKSCLKFSVERVLMILFIETVENSFRRAFSKSFFLKLRKSFCDRLR